MSKSETGAGLRSWLSRLNHTRKRNRRNRKVQSQFNAYLAGADTAEIAEIKRALSFLHPKKIDIPLVRIGPDNDGGYLVPDDLEGLSALFSPGVSVEFGFDLEIAGRGIECFLADASVRPPKDLPANMHFVPKFLGAKNEHPFITMQGWIEDAGRLCGDLILQMDIEGAEYEVLEDMGAALLSRFRIILLELHDMDRLSDAAWRSRFLRVASKLGMNHTLCHLHANNTAGFFRFDGKHVPQVLELCYVRSDRVTAVASQVPIPHPLDQPNSAKLPEAPFPLYWHGAPGSDR